MQRLVAPFRWIANRARALVSRAGAMLTGNAQAVTFSGALLMASIGFGLAWLPLGFIVPGSAVCAVMVAWRWRTAFGRRGDDTDA